MSWAVIVPFRGQDRARRANLAVAVSYWERYDAQLHVVSDGKQDGPFNRQAAYNAGARLTDAEVLVFAEADMIVPEPQIREAVWLAAERPGVVVPYTRFKAVGPRRVHTRTLHPAIFRALPPPRGPVATMWLHTLLGGTLMGPVNVLSRTTLQLAGGWDERLAGHGFDDLCMFRAFEIAAGQPRYITGPAWHLHHPKTRRINTANARRYLAYCAATTPEQIRRLTGRRHDERLTR